MIGFRQWLAAFAAALLMHGAAVAYVGQRVLAPHLSQTIDISPTVGFVTLPEPPPMAMEELFPAEAEAGPREAESAEGLAAPSEGLESGEVPAPPATADDEPGETGKEEATPLPPPNPLGPERYARLRPQVPLPRARPRAPGASVPSQEPAENGRQRRTGGSASLTNYQGRVIAHLRRHQLYPEEARPSKAQGTVYVIFSIDRKGRVTRNKISRSSGNSILDTAATGMVRRASPFPPIPADVGRPDLSFTVPVRFKP